MKKLNIAVCGLMFAAATATLVSPEQPLKT